LQGNGDLGDPSFREERANLYEAKQRHQTPDSIDRFGTRPSEQLHLRTGSQESYPLRAVSARMLLPQRQWFLLSKNSLK